MHAKDIEDDPLVSGPKVDRELDITSMTRWRWERDPDLSFPKPIKIRDRNYYRRSELNAFKERMLRQAIEARGR
ncbi:hypothetical protein [Bradyrhizobium sp. AZCC 1708]|uniref:hypothetical protein n=1 Tax=Bradyrhizobium sp. AZCC 1708 TaxID=3117015 RepID=UPI002FF020EA